MAQKIKVIIKRPDELIGHIEEINNTLERFQMIVKGHIETLPIYIHNGLTVICNEEGKLNQMKPNFNFGDIDVICGPVIVCGTDGDKFADVSIDLEEWEQILKAWGN